MLNYDGLVNAPVEDVAKATFAMLTKMQDYYKQPHIQIAAVACMFLLLCELQRAKPQDVFTAAKNLMASDAAGEEPHFKALRLYAQHELGIGK